MPMTTKDKKFISMQTRQLKEKVKSMSEEMKCCPFCGGSMTGYASVTKNENDLHEGQTICDRCGAQGPGSHGKTEDEAVRSAIFKSNRRVMSPAVKALVKAAKEMMTSHYVSSHKKIGEIREVLRAALAKVEEEGR